MFLLLDSVQSLDDHNPDKYMVKFLNSSLLNSIPIYRYNGNYEYLQKTFGNEMTIYINNIIAINNDKFN